MHQTIVGALEDDALRSMLGVLHVRLAGIQDVLVEWVYMLAYPRGQRIDVGGESVELLGLRPARFQSEGGQLFPIWLAEGAVHLTDGFRRGLEPHLDVTHPLYQIIDGLSRSLNDTVGGMYADEPPPPPSEPGPALRWRHVHYPKMLLNLGVVALLIRDFNREIRPFLFPWQSHFEGFQHLPDEARTLKIVRDLSEDLFTPTAELLGPQR
jgi:hypothetical protein